MKLSEFDYNLPKELIAQEPAKPRDHSRLLILDRKSGEMTDKYFYNIIDYLKKGDVLVLNNTKVFPARLIGRKKETGGKIEVFLLKKVLPAHTSLYQEQDDHLTPAPCEGEGAKARFGSVWLGIAAGERIWKLSSDTDLKRKYLSIMKMVLRPRSAQVRGW